MCTSRKLTLNLKKEENGLFSLKKEELATQPISFGESKEVEAVATLEPISEDGESNDT